MPSTPVYNLRYPGPDEAPNGPQGLQFLAEDTETALSGLIVNSGVLTNLGVSPAAGWAINVNQHHIIGKKLYLYLALDRTGSAITGNTGATYNIVGDPVIATITDASKRPTMDMFKMYRANVTSGSVQINSATGEIKIADLHTDSSIDTSHTVRIWGDYPIP